MANPYGIKVGQLVWFVPDIYSNDKTPGWLKVTKVGRQWATVGPHTRRFHLKTLAVDGGQYGHAGQIHLDHATWVAEEHRKKLWRELRAHVDRSAPPAHITSEQLDNFLTLLRTK